jgi:hypothetical protein
MSSQPSASKKKSPSLRLRRVRRGRQPICCPTFGLDEPCAHRCVPQRPSKVPCGLRVVVRPLATGGLATGDRDSLEQDVVHDHIRSGQHQIGAIAGAVVGIGARHVEDAGTTQVGETVSRSLGSGELSSGGGSAEMISGGCSDLLRP